MVSLRKYLEIINNGLIELIKLNQYAIASKKEFFESENTSKLSEIILLVNTQIEMLKKTLKHIEYYEIRLVRHNSNELKTYISNRKRYVFFELAINRKNSKVTDSMNDRFSELSYFQIEQIKKYNNLLSIIKVYCLNSLSLFIKELDYLKKIEKNPSKLNNYQNVEIGKNPFKWNAKILGDWSKKLLFDMKNQIRTGFLGQVKYEEKLLLLFLFSFQQEDINNRKYGEQIADYTILEETKLYPAIPAIILNVFPETGITDILSIPFWAFSGILTYLQVSNPYHSDIKKFIQKNSIFEN